MKKYELFLILSTAFLSVSCTDSFFDLEPSSSTGGNSKGSWNNSV